MKRPLFTSLSAFFSFLSTVVLTSINLSSVYGQPLTFTDIDLGYTIYRGTYNQTTNQTEFLSIRYAAPPIGTMN